MHTHTHTHTHIADAAAAVRDLGSLSRSLSLSLSLSFSIYIYIYMYIYIADAFGAVRDMGSGDGGRVSVRATAQFASLRHDGRQSQRSDALPSVSAYSVQTEYLLGQ